MIAHVLHRIRHCSVLFVGAALAVMSSNGAAHAIVIGTSLKEHPIQARTPARVILKFNSAIEVALSRVFLVSKGDTYRPLGIRAGAKRGELIVEVPALMPGDYALKYRAYAADGHLTEDAIRFTVPH